ncbi:MAG TPA: d(CMP) kinase [Sphingobium sp.]|uniref:(d)CMP kinase n=1 Tax=Sphingobium sp. TaxID=1912891 RepID=UPI002ED4B331
MIIAVDGPTASGKGTIARALAAHYGLPCLDTGLLYRAVGVHTVELGGDPDREEDAFRGAAFPEELLDDPELRTEASGALASRASRHPVVRQALLDRQRNFAAQPGGAILDGRDIGTVICPDADAKLFVTGSTEARAIRRHAEMVERGLDVSLVAITADLRERDARDTGRSAAPLACADDAALLDTSNLTIEEAVREAIALVDAQLERHHIV